MVKRKKKNGLKKLKGLFSRKRVKAQKKRRVNREREIGAVPGLARSWYDKKTTRTYE